MLFAEEQIGERILFCCIDEYENLLTNQQASTRPSLQPLGEEVLQPSDWGFFLGADNDRGVAARHR